MERSSYSFWTTANVSGHLLTEVYTTDRSLLCPALVTWSILDVSVYERHLNMSVSFPKIDFVFMVCLLKTCFCFDFIRMPKAQSCGLNSDFFLDQMWWFWWCLFSPFACKRVNITSEMTKHFINNMTYYPGNRSASFSRIQTTFR